MQTTYITRKQLMAPTYVFPKNTLVMFGDSITDLGSYYDSTTVAITDNSYWGWMQKLAKQPFELLYNAGISGQSTNQMLNRISRDVLAYNPGVVILGSPGTNSIYTYDIPVDTIKQEVLTMAGYIEAIGAKFIITTAWARSDAPVTAARQLAHMQLNEWIRNEARRRGWILVDGFAASVNPTSIVGAEKSLYYYDNLHMNNYGAYNMGKEYARIIQPLFPETDRLLASEFDTYDFNNNGYNKLGFEGFFLNAGASASPGMSGTQAQRWGLFRGAGVPTSVNSTPARSDGRGNNQRMTITSTAANDAVVLQSTQGANIAGRFSPGEWFQCRCEISVSSLASPGTGNPTNLNGIELKVPVVTNLGTVNVYDNFFQPALAQNYTEGFTGQFETPWYQIPVGAASITSITPNVTAYFSAAGGATVDVGRMSIIRRAITDNPGYTHDP